MVGCKRSFEYINSGYITQKDGTKKFYNPEDDIETPHVVKFLVRNRMFSFETVDELKNYIAS